MNRIVFPETIKEGRAMVLELARQMGGLRFRKHTHEKFTELEFLQYVYLLLKYSVAVEEWDQSDDFIREMFEKRWKNTQAGTVEQ